MWKLTSRAPRARAELSRDAFGLSYRSQLVAGVAVNLHRIDCLEILMDDWIDRPARDLDGLTLLADRIPITLHGVGLGLASVEPVDERRLAATARLVDRLRPVAWSEHLAFVRAGGIEIGHLATPPRTNAVLDGTIRNVERATKVVGSAPLLENVASLIEMPSRLGETDFLRAVLAATRSDLLIDLHNLHANASNFGFDPLAFLADLPPDRIRQVHLAGGRMIGDPGAQRVLDDHLHEVPSVVFELLSSLTARITGPLLVILERDGRYPPIESLIAELDHARVVVTRARARKLLTTQ